MLNHNTAEQVAQPEIEWTPIEKINEHWEKITAPRREQERLEAERRQAEAERLKAIRSAKRRSRTRMN